MKLTQAILSTLRLPRGVSDKVFFDDRLPGFGVRLRGSGARTWHVQYDYGGRTRRMSLGSVAVMTIVQARAAAQQILAKVKLGQDPAADKAAHKLKLNDTAGALIVPYLERQAKRLKPRSLEEMTRHLRRQAAPLHTTPIIDLDRRTIVTLLNTIAASSGPTASNRVRASLSAFFGWCVGSGYIEANPVSYSPRVPENSPRKRLLSDDELSAIWSVLGDDVYSVIIRLLLLTGCRRAEIGDLTWQEIDFPGARLVLPPERTKTKREHIVPLSDPALTVLQAQPRDRPHVFGRGSGGRGFQDWSGSKAELDARLAAAGHKLPPWSLHDFRRALSTAMNERLGVRPEVVEAILGHIIPGIAGVYNLAQHVEERRRALAKWAEHVTVSPAGQVLTLRRS